MPKLRRRKITRKESIQNAIKQLKLRLGLANRPMYLMSKQEKLLLLSKTIETLETLWKDMDKKTGPKKRQTRLARSQPLKKDS